VFGEPSIAYITHPARTYLLGLSGSLRHNFLLWDRVVPYIDGGGGFLNTNLRIQALGECIEFMAFGGAGVLFRVGERITVDAGWRYLHISNAGQTENRRNIGINSHFIHGGISWNF
jgi:opacity protein-like surface antigen